MLDAIDHQGDCVRRLVPFATSISLLRCSVANVIISFITVGDGTIVESLGGLVVVAKSDKIDRNTKRVSWNSLRRTWNLLWAIRPSRQVQSGTIMGC